MFLESGRTNNFVNEKCILTLKCTLTLTLTLNVRLKSMYDFLEHQLYDRKEHQGSRNMESRTRECPVLLSNFQ